MADYISIEAAIEAMNAKRQRDIDFFGAVIPECFPSESAIEALNEIPAADVVSRDCYNRILEENDAMREQLAAVGKKPGDKMDDVVKVVRCGECFHITDHDCPISWPKNENDFCSYGERRDK